MSGTNFSDNCDTMASNEHGCVQYAKTYIASCDILLALFPCVDLDRYKFNVGPETGQNQHLVFLHASIVRGSGGKNVIFSNGPNSTSECSKLLY